MVVKKKKPRISKVKRNNLKYTKLKKQGKLKHRRNRSKKNKTVVRAAPPVLLSEEEESDHGEGMLDMVEKDDLEFLKNAVSNQSYKLLNKIRYSSKTQREHKRRKKDEGEPEDIEKDYETNISQTEEKKTKQLLPIKTKDGLVRRAVEEPLVEQESGDGPELVEEKPVEEDSDAELELELLPEGTEVLDPSKPVSTAELLAIREKELHKRKLLIGALASSVLENPQLKAKNLKRLLLLMDEKNVEFKVTIRKLATVSLLEVFKDVLPSYQIKHQENTTGVKLKKDTLKLQGYEKTLLSSYKSYLQKLEKLVSLLDKKKRDPKKQIPQEQKLSEVALRCMCDLLMTHPYFNFSRNIAQMLVPFLNHPLPSLREHVANCISTVFREDKRGEITLDIVRRINHLVRSRSHQVHEEVLAVLLKLKIKDVNLDQEKQDELKQRKFMKHKQRLLALSKRERKRSKKLEALEKEMLETKAEENKQVKQQHLTEVTKLVFTIYFRVLKKAPQTRILSLTLEGLAKFAHCINLEFYEDIVNVLNQLLARDSLGVREQLHCTQTVFTLLSGHGEALNIDPLRFYTHLYRNLLYVNAGTNHGDILIILRALELAVIKRRKTISHNRLLAFTKRLVTLATQLLHNGSLGCLAIVKNILQMNKFADILLDPDTSVGEGMYFPELEDPEYCNAKNTALWELMPLTHHYHPTVCKFAKNILHNVPTNGEACLETELAKLSPEQLYSDFDPSEMIFRPPVPPPRKKESKPKCHKRMFQDKDLELYVNKIFNSEMDKACDFWQVVK